VTDQRHHPSRPAGWRPPGPAAVVERPAEPV